MCIRDSLYCVPNDAYGAEQMAETGMTAAVQTFLVRKDLYEDMGSPDMSTPEGFLNTLCLLYTSLRAMLAELLRKKIWSKLLVRQPLTARMNSSAMVGRIH